MAEDADAPDEDLVELSIVAPTEFVAARNTKAKELRAAKERDRAAVVAKLSKPTWTAWALNVLARREPDAVGAWLEAGAELETALGAGDRDALRDAQQRERASLAATIELADQILREEGRTPDDQTAQKLTGTLRAAITDDGVRARLVHGVLDDDAEAPTFGFGFGGADASVVSLDSARAKRAAGRGRAGGAKKAPARGKKGAAAPDDDAAARADEEAQAAAEAEEEARRAERLAAERARLAADVDARQGEVDDRRAAAEAADEAARLAHEALDVALAALEDARSALDALPRADD